MCLITFQKEPSIAEEDMVVYKQLRQNFTSIFHDMKWKVGVEYETEIQQSEYPQAFDTMDEVEWWREIESNPEEEYKAYGQGFHSALTKERLMEEFNSKYDIIVQCKIPAGSQYYVGVSGLVVSNRLVVCGKIEV